MWFRAVSSRRMGSTMASTLSPWDTLPSTTLPKCIDQPGHDRLGVRHRYPAVRSHDVAGVAHLAAALRVERRLHDRQLHLVALGRTGYYPVAGDHTHHHAVGPDLLVAEELRPAYTQALVEADLHPVGAELGRCPRPLALGGHLPLEALHVDADAALRGDLLGHLYWESVRVPQAESRLAGQRVRVSHGVGQDRVAVLEGREEALFLQPDDGLDELTVVPQLGVGFAHEVRDGVGHFAQEGLVEAEPAGVPDRPADEPPQDVPAPVVGGHHAVCDEERRAAPMLGHYPHRLPDLVALTGLVAGQRLHFVDERQEQVRLVYVVRVLQNDHKPLESHPRVYAGLGQRGHGAVGIPVELHEHEIPQLHVALAEQAGIRVQVLAVGAAVGEAAARAGVAEVVVQLGARPAGPLLTVNWGPPPVVRVSEPVDALLGDAVLLPQAVCLVVSLVHGRGEVLPRQTHRRLQALDGEAHGPILEVVAEAEVPQHLEHRQVGGIADLVDVDGAEGLLRGRHAAVRGRRLAREVGFELDHARVGEQQRRVAHRDQRRARRPQVALRLEVLQE